ncbi:MAG TPA: J domain-containing protein [Opitutaceae bacterium]|jgi:curved DNA-binding protein
MPLDFKDYYETLGVQRSASADEIKQAFRKLARVHHPDVAKNKKAGEARFKEINEAYEVLGDPEKRRRYDELGANWQDVASGRGAGPGRRGPQARTDFEFGGTGFSDFFESFFGGGRGAYGPSYGRAGRDDGDGFSHPGNDVEADLMVTLEEALKGSVRSVTLRRTDGRGGERSDTYKVRIPAGVHEGQRIRLSGQGGPGLGGGPPGDLYLRVRLARHPDFTVKGHDLYCDLDLAPWEAVLGTRASIPTLDGATTVRVPAGTQAGGHLRLRGLGLPREDGTRGDLYGVATIQVPEAATAEEKGLWEKLAKASAFRAREAP